MRLVTGGKSTKGRAGAPRTLEKRATEPARARSTPITSASRTPGVAALKQPNRCGSCLAISTKLQCFSPRRDRQTVACRRLVSKAVRAAYLGSPVSGYAVIKLAWVLVNAGRLIAGIHSTAFPGVTKPTIRYRHLEKASECHSGVQYFIPAFNTNALVPAQIWIE